MSGPSIQAGWQRASGPPRLRAKVAEGCEPVEWDANHVMAMAGITKRQVQWWDERGLVRPTHRAHRRYYDASEAALVCVVAELLRKGYTLPRCRRLKHALVREIQIAAGPGGRCWVVVDRKRVLAIDSLHEVADFQRLDPVTVVYLTPILNMVGL